MLKFKEFDDKSLKKIQKFTKNSPYRTCDLSAGVLYMWNDIYNLQYAVSNGTLILKCNFKNKKTVFFLPLGADFDGAMLEIERYAQKNKIPLSFMCVEEKYLEILSNRYNGNITSEYNRDYSDYLYDYQQLKTLVGKKFSGQRNHINGFNKNYPNAKFKKLQKKDAVRLKAFLKEYKKEHQGGGRVERAEYKNTLKLVDNLNLASYVGGYMEIDGKLCSFTIGEYVGDTFIIHIEKALKNYKGIYPATFNAFLKASEKEGINYINREDDSGDLGLRTSKTQYQPIKLIHKHFVSVSLPMQIKTHPKIVGDRLYLSKIKKSDKKDYFELYTDKTLNKYWGYDYKKHIKTPTEDAFFNMQSADFKEKDNMCLGIFKNGDKKLIGEVVLHNFTYDGDVEVGIRLFKKYHGMGYGTEAVKLIASYAKTNLKKRPVAKCYKQNIDSLQCLKKAGFGVKNSDKTYYYLNFEN